MRLPLACLLALSFVSIAQAETREQLTQQVRDAENAFAATMAARDHEAFATFIAEDAGSACTKSRTRRSRGARKKCRCSTRVSSRTAAVRCSTRRASASARSIRSGAARATANG